jgi:hypothetical protein
LKTRIENEGIEKIKSAEWIRIDAVNISFPSLSEEEIRCLAICVYQVNLAKSYVQEHLNEQAEFTVYVSNKMNKLQSVFAERSYFGASTCLSSLFNETKN